MSPVANQGNCANCWAVSFVEIMTAITNRYLPEDARKFYLDISNDPYGKTILSIDQLTQCTSIQFYKRLK